jgi:hypothetical protein
VILLLNSRHSPFVPAPTLNKQIEQTATRKLLWFEPNRGAEAEVRPGDLLARQRSDAD